MASCPIQNNGCFENPYSRRGEKPTIGVSIGGLGHITIGGEGTTANREAIQKVAYGGDGNTAN